MGALSAGRCLVWICVLEMPEKAAEKLKSEFLSVHQQSWLLLQQYFCIVVGVWNRLQRSYFLDTLATSSGWLQAP